MDQELFSKPLGTPLAARMRPRELTEFVGQEQAVAAGGAVDQLIKLGPLSATSILLIGPPGTGKTTLARIIAQESGRDFIELSAINSGVKELRDAIARSTESAKLSGLSAIVFIDEIHRYSKTQQDALLSALEDGSILLIGATTENPSFALTNALMSRLVLVRLVALNANSIAEIIANAARADRGLADKFELEGPVTQMIADLAAGDARKALTILDVAAAKAAALSSPNITTEHVAAVIDVAMNRFDRSGDAHYDTISAFIKSVRGSDADAAIHYLARMLEGGEDPRFIARRLVILASEDIGLADPQALTLAVSAAAACAQLGMPEARIPLAQATIYLALCPKSNSAYNAINAAIADVQAGKSGSVPTHLRGSATSTYAANDKGLGYRYPHDFEPSSIQQQYIPSTLENAYYYQPKRAGFEQALIERWQNLRAMIRGLKK